MVIDFLSHGWPINYTAPTHPVSSLHNHPFASQFASHLQDYIDIELSWNAIAGPFVYPPFSDDLVSSPLKQSLNEVHRSNGNYGPEFSSQLPR